MGKCGHMHVLHTTALLHLSWKLKASRAKVAWKVAHGMQRALPRGTSESLFRHTTALMRLKLS